MKKAYVISESVKERLEETPGLYELIMNTKSMDDEERQYWFDIFLVMTDSQVSELFEILDTEKKKLDALEAKYKDAIKDLNEKHLVEYRSFVASQNNSI